MSKEEELLLDSLNLRKPILLLGAGFSAGAQCNGVPIPVGKELKEHIFEEFYVKHPPKYTTKKDIEDIKEYELDKLCGVIKDEKRGNELDRFLISIFKGAEPSPTNHFHKLITKYYWDKIYTLNIDDLVENIYSEEHIECVVQNERKKKPFNQLRQIIKLHGCVNNPEAGFIFGEGDYISRIAEEDYRLKEFVQDYYINDIIFLGTEFNENDIKILIEKNRNSGFVSNNCRYFFISPKVSYKLKMAINGHDNYYYIDWTTEKFLKECEKLNKGKKDLKTYELLLEQHGFLKVYNYRIVPNNYESQLYYGQRVNLFDIFANWDVINNKTYDICDKIEREGKGKSFVFVVYGGAFVGKTVAAYRILVELYKRGYTSYIYNCDGEEELRLFYEFVCKETSLKKVAVLIDDAAYIYDAIVSYSQKIPQWIESIVFILISNKNKHQSKKHELNGIACREWLLKDEFDDKTPKRIYAKLDEKNRLGNLKGLSEREAVYRIAKSKSLIEFLFELTHGIGFKNYFRKALDTFLISALENELNYLKLVCVLTKLGIHNIKEELLMLNCSNVRQNVFADIIVGFGQSSGVTLRCSEAFDEFLYSLSETERVAIVYKAIMSIANMFREEENNRWKNIFEQILRVKSLHNNLKLSPKLIIELFTKIEKTYNNVSYFWLQRGLAKQLDNEYDDAANFLQQALSIRPNSYQIRHAIAKNKLDQAIYIAESNYSDSVDLFERGILELKNLIDSPRFSKNICYSVHSYILSCMKYYNKIKLEIPHDRIIIMQEILVQASIQNYDGWMKDCRKLLEQYCRNYAQDLESNFSTESFKSFEKYTYIKSI